MSSKEYAFRGRKFSVKIKERTMPSGKKVKSEIVEFTGSVAILPLIDIDTLLLLKQYRTAVEEWIYEIPAGTLEVGETPQHCAMRELEEETGYKPGKLKELFEIYVAPGYSTEKLHAYIATDLQVGTFKPDEGEEITIVKKPLREVLEMIKSNEICDAKTIATVLYYLKVTKSIQT